MLFNMVVDAVMRKVFTNRCGVQFGENEFITDLMFADDSVVFADTEAEASAIIHDIKDAAYPYGLTINADKTKVLTSNGSPVIINLDNVQLEQVQYFKYLGSIVEEQKIAATADITNRIGQAARVFGMLTWCFWRKNNVNISTKMRIYRSLVLSLLLYGAESWTPLLGDLKKLEAFQMSCLRRLLGVSIRDKIRNETIREWCCNQPTICEEIQKRRMRWFGHICRMNPHRLPHRLLWRSRATGWKVQRNAPKKTWLKIIEEDLARHRLSPVEAKERALNKQQWKVITRNVINGVVAPTAAYWLRDRPPPDVR